MKSKKIVGGGDTRIVLEGSGKSFTAKEAAQAVEELRAQLWRGLPITRAFLEARRG